MKVVLIINPASGSEFPILSVANRIFNEHGVEWEPRITKTDGDAFVFAQEGHKQKVDAVLVYGGDGTVMEAAAALYNSSTPLGIIPGGTANIIAREVFIPQNPEQAIHMFATNVCTLNSVGMGEVCINDGNINSRRRFILRLSLGHLAEMVASTNRDKKNKLGRFAYTVSAIEQMPNISRRTYQMSVDGGKIEVEGATLMVTNAGSVGLSGLRFNSRISIADGRLDVIVIKEANISALAQLLAGAITDNIFPAVEHWHGKNISIEMDEPSLFICDDTEYKASKLDISIMPKSILVMMPNDL